MPVLLEQQRRVRDLEAGPHGDVASAIARAKRDLMSDLSGGATFWYLALQTSPLPRTMTQPVAFDDESDERLRVVRLRHVDESEDEW